MAACAGLWLDASFDRPLAALGESVRIRTTAVNRSNTPVVLKAVNFRGATLASASCYQQDPRLQRTRHARSRMDRYATG